MGGGTNKPPMDVPRITTIIQGCVKHQIQDSIIRNTHFNDLYILLMRLDILELKQAIKLQQQKINGKHKNNDTVRNINAKEAVNFLKGR